jgi:hypothetical protein
MRRHRLARAAVIILGIAPLGAIVVAFVVAMNAAPCRRNCPTDIYAGIPFMLLGALVWLGVALLVARAVSRRELLRERRRRGINIR